MTPFASISERGRGLAQHVERRAHDLRLAAQAIGILHTAVAHQMRSADRRAFHQPPAAPRLPRSARGGDAGDGCAIERRVRAARRIGGEGTGDKGRAEQPLGLEQGGERVSGRELRAVQQRQPLLRAERQWCQTGGRSAPAPRARGDRRRRSRRRRSWWPTCATAARDRPTRRPEPWQGTTGVSPLASSASSKRTVVG